MLDDKPQRRRDDGISSNQIVGWLVTAFGTLIFVVLCWVGSKAAEIPSMQERQIHMTGDMEDIKKQLIDFPVIKNQMDNMAKQLDRMNSTEEVNSRAIEENRVKLLDHDQRLKYIENEMLK